MRTAARIAPSILAGDFARLGEDVDRIADVVDLLHVDVMDGHFVPNISLGPPVIASLDAATDLYLDCHLMITDPVRYLEPLKESGADGVTGHIEAIPDPGPFFKESTNLGLDASLALNPATPVESVMPFLEQCSMVVVMSVNPGFGGQSFISAALSKIEALREIIDSRGLATDIEVDGGVDLTTVGQARSAGADVFVAGTAVFRAIDPRATVGEMRTVISSNGGA